MGKEGSAEDGWGIPIGVERHPLFKEFADHFHRIENDDLVSKYIESNHVGILPEDENGGEAIYGMRTHLAPGSTVDRSAIRSLWATGISDRGREAFLEAREVKVAMITSSGPRLPGAEQTVERGQEQRIHS